MKKTKVERVVALSRTLGIKLANVFGDVPPKDAATSPSSLRFPIHGFQGTFHHHTGRNMTNEEKCSVPFFQLKYSDKYK